MAKKKEYLNNFTRRGKKENYPGKCGKKRISNEWGNKGVRLPAFPTKEGALTNLYDTGVWLGAGECWCKLCRASVLISLSFFRSFLIKPKIALLYIFSLDSRCSVSVILQLVGRPVWVQFIDLFSLFFNLFTFIFQLQYPVGNVVQ